MEEELRVLCFEQNIIQHEKNKLINQLEETKMQLEKQQEKNKLIQHDISANVLKWEKERQATHHLVQNMMDEVINFA